MIQQQFALKYNALICCAKELYRQWQFYPYSEAVDSAFLKRIGVQNCTGPWLTSSSHTWLQ